MSILRLNSRRNYSLITLALLTISILAPAFLTMKVRGSGDPWWNPNWLYRKQVKIDHTQVTADLTNFPLLINLTDTDLASKAQSNGYDIAFADNNGNKLSHEIESYSSTSGRLVAWVKTNLSHTTDTILYMYYGNPTAPNQQDKNGVWDSNYKMVQHLSETSGTHYDSTANGKNAAPNGGVSQGIAGKIDGADSFAGDAHQYLDVGSISASDWTISFWANSRDTNAIVIYPIGLGPDQTGIGMGGWYFQVNQHFYFYDGTNLVLGGPTVIINTWYYVVVTKSGTTYTIYVNGVSNASGTISNVGITDLTIGLRAVGAFPFNGIIDEVRVSGVARSSDLISTEYNNQQAPSSFYSVGSEEINQFPPTASNPSPGDGAIEVSTSLTKLSFDLVDINNDPINYEVTTSPNIGSGSDTGVGNGRYDVSVSGLQLNTVYTWHVNATDPTGSGGSGQWNNVTFSFTTIGYTGQSWLTGWQYRKSHVIKQATGAGTDYQTEVKVSYSAPASPSWFTVLSTNIPIIMTNDVTSNGTIFAGDNNYNIYKSIDNGTTFTKIFTIPLPPEPLQWGLMAGRVWTTFVDSRNYVYVSAGSTNRLYRSTDYGKTFTMVLDMPDRDDYACADIITMTEDKYGNLYGAEYADTTPPGGCRLWKSTDQGATWNAVSQRWDARHLHGAFYNPYNDWLYVEVGEGGGADYQTVWRSTDFGNNWVEVVPRGADDYATKYLSMEFMGDDVFMGQDHQGGSEPALIQKITDDGGDHAFTPVTVYDSPYKGALFTSATKLGNTMFFSTCAESVDMATCQVVMSNDGTHWTILNAQPVSAAYIYINRLTVHPRTGFVYGCINYNYAYFIASPSTPRPPQLQGPLSTVFTAGHCRTDFGDIRFTAADGVTLLDYWMETKTDGDYATFWVKVGGDLGSADRTIYVYYGKSDATTTSNPYNTFIFFDDFSGDLSKWTIISGAGAWGTDGVGDLVIQPAGTADNNYIVTASNIGANNIAIRTRIRSEIVGTTEEAHPGLIWHANADIGTNHRNDQVYFRPHSTGTNIQPAYFEGTGGDYEGLVWHDTKSGSYYTWNTWSTVEVRIPSSGNVKLHGDDSYWHDWGNQQYNYNHVGLVAHGYGKDYFDYFAVRKYVDPEPAHSSWGDEETLIVDSCRSSGTKNDQFNLGEEIWITGNRGYSPSTTYNVYVVVHQDWTDGMAFPTRVPGTVETVTSNPDGSILAKVWDSAQLGKYDIVIDITGDGKYHAGIDPIDNMSVYGAGFFVVPEYALGTILAMGMCFAGVGVYYRRFKHRKLKTL
jgi:hypothetical protein